MNVPVEQKPKVGRPPVVAAEALEELVTSAARAPSVHNTQPWRFAVTIDALELHADQSRRLKYLDPDGRQMLISCGAALFGLRLGVRRMGYRPVVELMPGHPDAGVVARVRLGAASPFGMGEQALWTAMRRRHTHRGPFSGEPLPPGLLAVLQRQAEAEGATLALIQHDRQYGQLAALAAAAETRQQQHPIMSAELRSWTRPAGSQARDGVSARAYVSRPTPRPRFLAQRDFDLGRGWGRLASQGAEPAATAVLVTKADTPADWLRAGQALHRVLLRAAVDWVFATMHTQALEIAPARSAIRSGLRLRGAPQMVLQLGRAHVAALTSRRSANEMIIVPDGQPGF